MNNIYTIYIGNLSWDVEFVDENDERLIDMDTQGIGMCCCSINKIYIANNLSDFMLRRILIHELCHAYLYSNGFNTLVNTNKRYNEEDICELFAAFGDLISLSADKILDNYFSDLEPKTSDTKLLN